MTEAWPLFLAAAILALPVRADQPIMPDEFDRMTVGRIVEYIEDGVVDGHEQHLPDRKVVWRDADGECQDGWWEPRGNEVCFWYEYGDEENCVVYTRTGDVLMARDRDREGGWNTYVLRILDGPPLPCPRS